MRPRFRAKTGDIINERARAALFGGRKLELYLMLDYLRIACGRGAVPRPRMIQLEPTRKCNLGCSMCLRGEETDGSSMRFEFFRKIMTGDFRYPHFLLLYGQGEPFMAEDLFSMIRFERNNGNYVTTVTNGTCIDGEICGEIVASGLNSLRISIDGASKSTYNAVRNGADFDRVMGNVDLLSGRIRDARSNTKLALTFMALKENFHDMPEIIRIASRFGIDCVEIKDLPPYADSPMKPLSVEIAEDARIKDELVACVDEMKREARRRRVTVVTSKFHCLHGTGICKNPWFKTFITWDGRVTLCSRLFSCPSAVMGDLRQSTFEQIWNGAAYGTVREMLGNGAVPLPECRTVL